MSKHPPPPLLFSTDFSLPRKVLQHLFWGLYSVAGNMFLGLYIDTITQGCISSRREILSISWALGSRGKSLKLSVQVRNSKLCDASNKVCHKKGLWETVESSQNLVRPGIPHFLHTSLKMKTLRVLTLTTFPLSSLDRCSVPLLSAAGTIQS